MKYKVKLFPNHNDKSEKVAKELQQKLEAKGFQISEDDFTLAIAIGGDGSFLRMIHQCQFSKDKLYIGVNTGTLGFAQEIYPEAMDDFIEKLEKKEYKEEKIGIETTTITYAGKQIKLESLNEIVIREKELNTVNLNIYIDKEILERFSGDGILISTSFGSTAYNLSFGGSIVYNDLHTMQITPVAPLNSKSYTVLRNSIIIPEKRKVSIKPLRYNKNLMITVDGENQLYDDVTKIEISVSKKINLLRMNNYDYTRKINEKFV